MSPPDTDDLPDWGVSSKVAAVRGRDDHAGFPPEPEPTHPVDYSAQLRDMLGDAGDTLNVTGDENDEEFGEFVYTGRDAGRTSRRPDDDDDEEDDAAEAELPPEGSQATSQEVTNGTVSPVQEDTATNAVLEPTSPRRSNGGASSLGDGRPSPLSPAESRVTSASNDEFPALRNRREGLTRARSSYGSIASIAQSTSGSQFPQRPLAHPAFSRLRSISTQTTPHSRNVSSSTYNTALEYPTAADGPPQRPGLASGAGSVSRSIFGGASRRSSVSNILDLPSASEVPTGTSVSGASSIGAGERVRPAARTVKWSPLRKISGRAFPPATGSAGAAALSQAEQMVKSSMGQPTVMAVHGLIAIGTTRGWTLVFDFTQNLRCVCGTEAIANESGAVTALAVSQDHTFVAVGHENGSIHLYALIKPSQPARSVPPVTLPQVLSGRKEGHLVGSKICRLGFAGERHTAIVSSDDQGLAFYHSLGKVLMLASTDIIRMLGRYPDPASAPSGAAAGTAIPQRPPLSTAQTAPPRASVASPPDSRPESPADFAQRPRIRSTDPDQPAFPRPSRAAGPLAGSGKKPAVVLDMAPLPLGSAPHPASDALSLVAILTPTKLVVVGLKPTPRTWWRFALPRRDPELPDPQEPDGDAERGFAVTGVLAWWPSQRRGGEKVENNDRKALVEEGESPLLAWASGKRVRVARVRSKGDAAAVAPATRRLAQNPLKAPPPPTGVDVETFAEIECDAAVFGLRWYTERVVIVITSANLDVFDIGTKQRLGRDPINIDSLVSSDLLSSAFEPFLPCDGVLATSYSGAFAVYKRKLFELRREDVRAGAILAWADRVLALMQPATILDAIETATAYYSGQVDASTIFLPESPSERRALLEPRLREILAASVDFVFSEDRLRDGSHSDGETIQRLFEGLVATSVHACLALGDADWLFDELYERYEQNGIEGIFLDRLEPFVLGGAVHALPPSVTQRLIAVRADRQQYDAAERIILHVEPSNLDLNQALRLCEGHNLYDGLFHVYSQALNDWTTPVIEVLDLVQRIVEERQGRPRHPEDGADPVASYGADWSDSQSPAWMEHVGSYDERVETLSPTVYKLFSFLSYTWLGLAYPSGCALDEAPAVQGRRDTLALLFSSSAAPPSKVSGRSSLVLPDVPYPNVTLLLRYDAEALLDTLDQAFEDPFLDGEDGMPTSVVSAQMQRQDIVDILLHVASTDGNGLSSVDLTFIRIFVARNLPKYPQYIRLSPATQQQILVNLVTDADQSTLEDRQLATEYLLSTYTPREIDTLVPLLERAGFLRILRQLYRSEGRWSDLAMTYLRDDTLEGDIFALLESALQLSARAGPDEKRKLADVIVGSTSDLATRGESALSRLARLVSTFLPDRHADVLQHFDATEWRRFVYLRCLFEPEEGDGADVSPDPALLRDYVASLCRSDPRHLVTFLSNRPTKEAQDPDLLAVCEKAGSYDALVWALDKQGEPVKALARASEALEMRTDSLLELLLDANQTESPASIDSRQRNTSVAVEQIRAVTATAIQVCVARTTGHRRLKGVDPEELWYNLLSSLVATLRAVRSIAPTGPSNHRDAAERRASLSSLIQHGADEQALGGNASELLLTMIPDALSALVSSTTSQDVSFPRLVRRLIEATPSGSSTSSSYAEFKGVITSMLDTYAFEGDLLDQSSVITAQDLFVVVEAFKQERERGWRPGRGTARTSCAECLQPLWASGDRPTSPAMSRSASASLLAESLGSERPRMQKRPSIKGKEVDWPGLAPPARSPNLLSQESASIVAGKDGRLWHLACHLVRSV